MDPVYPRHRELIANLEPLRAMTPKQREQVISAGELLEFEPGQRVFDKGDTDPRLLFLLEGRVDLVSDGHLVKSVSGATDAARRVLAQAMPRRLAAIAREGSVVFAADRALLEDAPTWVPLSPGDTHVEVSEIVEREPHGAHGDWMTRLLQGKLLSRLPAANIQQLFARMHPVEVEPGQAIVRQGDPGDGYYLVREGRCLVTRHPEGQEDHPIRLAELGVGDGFGEEALVAGGRHGATVRLSGPGSVVRIVRADFDRLIKAPLLSTVTRDEARVRATAGARWLDVRDAGAPPVAPGVVRIPLGVLRGHLKRLDADVAYIVCCDDGERGSVASFLLGQHGFESCCLVAGVSGDEQAVWPPAGDVDAVPDEEQGFADAMLEQHSMRSDRRLAQVIELEHRADRSGSRMAVKGRRGAPEPRPASTPGEPRPASTPRKPRPASTPNEPRLASTPSEPPLASTPSEPRLVSTPSEPRLASTPREPRTEQRPDEARLNGLLRSARERLEAEISRADSSERTIERLEQELAAARQAAASERGRRARLEQRVQEDRQRESQQEVSLREARERLEAETVRATEAYAAIGRLEREAALAREAGAREQEGRVRAEQQLQAEQHQRAALEASLRDMQQRHEAEATRAAKACGEVERLEAEAAVARRALASESDRLSRAEQLGQAEQRRGAKLEASLRDARERLETVAAQARTAEAAVERLEREAVVNRDRGVRDDAERQRLESKLEQARHSSGERLEAVAARADEAERALARLEREAMSARARDRREAIEREHLESRRGEASREAEERVQAESARADSAERAARRLEQELAAAHELDERAAAEQQRLGTKLTEALERVDVEAARALDAQRALERQEQAVAATRESALHERVQREEREREHAVYRGRAEARVRCAEARTRAEQQRYERELEAVREQAGVADADARRQRALLEAELQSTRRQLDESEDQRRAAAVEERRRRLELKAAGEAARSARETEAERAFCEQRDALRQALAEDRSQLRTERRELAAQADRLQSLLEQVAQVRAEIEVERSSRRAGASPVEAARDDDEAQAPGDDGPTPRTAVG